MKNYYFILGVDSSATQEEIKAAYRHHAKELHPDYYGQDSRPFLDMQEAYAILSDPTRRRAYDKVFGRTYVSDKPGTPVVEPLIPKRSAPEPLIPTQGQVDLGDLSLSASFHTVRPSFDELFDRFWRNFDLVRPEVERLQSLNVEIRISPSEALQGGRVRLLVPAQLKCQLCDGRGGVDYFECGRCGGTGFVVGEYPVSVVFPPGVVNSYVVQVPLEEFGIVNFYVNAIFRVGDR